MWAFWFFGANHNPNNTTFTETDTTMATTKAKNGSPVDGDFFDLVGDISNSGEFAVDFERPYIAELTITGTAPLLFHRYQADAVEEASNTAKGSRAKKTDNVESYVWRDERNRICMPGEYVRASIVDSKKGAAKFRQDPRSPRKSAVDLFNAGIISLTNLAPMRGASGNEMTTWDALDRRRVTVNRAAITRSRPCINEGWSADFEFMIILPQYIDQHLLHGVLTDAGRLVGIADFRPTFGRFSITSFKVREP